MSFEYRKIIDELEDFELSVLAEGNELRMLSLSVKSKDIFYDNDVWLKYELLPALKAYVFRGSTEEHESVLDFIPKETDRLALFEMFIRAEASGWLVDIKKS